MTAVLGLDRETLQKACDGARALGVVEICNDNCPGQLVISGARAAVEQAGVLAKELGAKRCMPLKVSGPFHTSLMASAGNVLQKHFETLVSIDGMSRLFQLSGRTSAEGGTNQ